MFGFLACLQILLISLLVALAVGCNDGQGDDQAPVDVFPQHDAPLGTDRGGQYLAGRLVLDNGCLRVEVPSNDASNPLPSRLSIIWPSAFTLSTEDGAVRIVDGLGRIAAVVGDHVRLSRAAFTYEEAQARGLIRGLSADCAGSYLLVGDEVTAFDPNNEPTELRLSDPDVFFLRQRTVIAESRVPGSGVRGRGSGERETTASSLAGKEESSRKEDNSGQGKDGPAGAIAQGGNGR